MDSNDFLYEEIDRKRTELLLFFCLIGWRRRRRKINLYIPIDCFAEITSIFWHLPLSLYPRCWIAVNYRIITSRVHIGFEKNFVMIFSETRLFRIVIRIVPLVSNVYDRCQELLDRERDIFLFSRSITLLDCSLNCVERWFSLSLVCQYLFYD